MLTDASASGAIDYLTGLKENVIIGRLIPTDPARASLETMNNNDVIEVPTESITQVDAAAATTKSNSAPTMNEVDPPQAEVVANSELPVDTSTDVVQ